MPIFTDQMSRRVTIPPKPSRIISLVPSQTELLAELGLEDQVAGITKFCIHPEKWFRTKPRVGGTKQLRLDKITGLEPDLIIGNKEENDRQQVASLMEKYPVWISDVKTLEDALDMIRAVGSITGKGEQAAGLANNIRIAFDELPEAGSPSRSAAYLIWRKPFMAAGKDTFIHEMLTRAGFANAFNNRLRYPEVTGEELRKAAPEVVLLSSEPYPFREKHIREIRTWLPDSEVRLVDGTFFSWYGSRLLHAPAYFREIRNDFMG